MKRSTNYDMNNNNLVKPARLGNVAVVNPIVRQSVSLSNTGSNSVGVFVDGSKSEPALSNNELTNLNWLQQDNLLDKLNVPNVSYSASIANTSESVKSTIETPAEDLIYVGEDYDPKVHVKYKPPFSMCLLIFLAIEDSPLKMLQVRNIYQWILKYFPFYRTATINWKGLVRHSLSLSRCFRKFQVPSHGEQMNELDLVKGSYWFVDPDQKSAMKQSLAELPILSFLNSTREDGDPASDLELQPELSRPPSVSSLMQSNVTDMKETPGQCSIYVKQRIVELEEEVEADIAASVLMVMKNGPPEAEKKRTTKQGPKRRKRKSQEQILISKVTDDPHNAFDHSYTNHALETPYKSSHPKKNASENMTEIKQEEPSEIETSKPDTNKAKPLEKSPRRPKTKGIKEEIPPKKREKRRKRLRSEIRSQPESDSESDSGNVELKKLRLNQRRERRKRSKELLKKTLQVIESSNIDNDVIAGAGALLALTGRRVSNK